MSHVVSLGEINQFLPHTKLDTDDHTDVRELEDTAKGQVFARLSGLYDTSTWAGPDSTPVLVRSIISLLVAGRVYNRQFAEESADGNSYGQRRIDEAYMLLEGIIEGHYDLDDASLVSPTAGLPSVEESEPIFEMGRAF